MIIDIHTHCFPDELAPRAVPLLAEKAGIPAYTDGTTANLKNSMQLSGVDISVLQPIATKPGQTVSINRWAAGVQDRNIVSFGTIHPELPGWEDEVRWLASSGIKGVKFHPDYQEFFVDDPKVLPIYEALFRHDMVVLFHAGIDIGIPGPCHCTPSRLKKVADIFSGARIIAAHMGGYLCWNEVEEYLAGSGVYLDTSYSCSDLGIPGMEKLIRKHGADRILFGSDSPWGDQAAEISSLKSMALTGAELDMILGGNAKRLLCL